MTDATDRRLFCELTNGPIVHLGLLSATSLGGAEPPATIAFHTSLGQVDATLVRVTPKLVYYRQAVATLVALAAEVASE